MHLFLLQFHWQSIFFCMDDNCHFISGHIRSCNNNFMAICLNFSGRTFQRDWFGSHTPSTKSMKELSDSWFENLKKLRFCLELTHKNTCNSLNFWARWLVFWMLSYLYVCNKSYLASKNLSLISNFSKFFVFDV